MFNFKLCQKISQQIYKLLQIKHRIGAIDHSKAPLSSMPETVLF